MPRPKTSVARSPQMAWFITAPLALLTPVLAIAAQINTPLVGRHWWLAVLYLALFLAADGTVLLVEIRRQTFYMTLAEVPLLVALFYLPPLLVVVIRALSLLITSRFRLRQPTVKLWFNVTSAAAATAVAVSVVVGLGPIRSGDVDPRDWFVLFLAVSVYALVATGSNLGVMALVQRQLTNRDVVRTGGTILGVSFVNITFGLVILLVLQQSAWGVLLLGTLVAVFWIGYRSYAQFVRQHHTLAEMYDLTQAVRVATYDGTLSDTLLRRVRGLLRAEYATLWLPPLGRYPEVLLSARIDDSGLLDVAAIPDTLRKRAVETGETVAVGTKHGDELLRSELRQQGTKDAIVVPLRSGDAVIGSLEVAGRLAAATSFEDSDIRLLEAVATNVAIAVENSRLVDRLRFDAYHDALTALPNRRRVSAALEESVTVRAPGEVVAVLLFDVDGLRDVNDSLGHASGDKLLAEVARRLRTLAPPAALVGRVGGDEFVVTLRASSTDAAVQLAVDLRQQLQDPMVFGTLTLDVDTAVGVAVHPDHGADSATLLQRADVAVQAAKHLADGVQLFNLGLESRSVRRLGLAGDLRRALDADELEVYFQPKVSLPDRRLIGVECLARWEHPAHGPVAAEDFVAVAEHTGQLNRLTEAVLREGLRRCRQWDDAGRPLTIAVNLSVRTLVDPSFPSWVDELLREYGVPAERLTFDIAEGGVVGGLDRPLPTLHRLHDLGVRLAVDDFGTGSSSLSYLRRLPVHEVKIDRSFVQGMATDPGDLAIVRAVVDLARHFGLTAVAEGVESELTLNLLEEIGCDLGQGFLFSRPLPYERLEAWFAAQTEAEPTPLGEVRRLRAVM